MIIHRKHLQLFIDRSADVPYVENSEEYEEGVDDEGKDVGEGCEGEGHDDRQQGEEEGVGGGGGDEHRCQQNWSAAVASPPLLSISAGLVWLLPGCCSLN